MQSAKTSTRRGFTLIELLVVIAIIAVLVGLLLPSLRAARAAGWRTVCLSNQRQIGTALAMYAEAYREYMPRESGISEALNGGKPQVPAWFVSTAQRATVNISWAFNLRPLLDERCVSSENNGGLADNFADAPYYRDPARPKDPHNIHYVNNGLRFRFNQPGVRTCLTTGKPPVQISRMVRPSQTAYLTCFTDDPNGLRWGNTYAAGTTAVRISEFYDMWGPSLVDGSQAGVTTAQRVSPRRHDSGANVLYLDTHAGIVPAKTVQTLPMWDDGDNS